MVCVATAYLPKSSNEADRLETAPPFSLRQQLIGDGDTGTGKQTHTRYVEWLGQILHKRPRSSLVNGIGSEDHNLLKARLRIPAAPTSRAELQSLGPNRLQWSKPAGVPPHPCLGHADGALIHKASW